MNNPETTAGQILKHVVALSPTALVIGEATAFDLALFVAPHISTCPACGACAGVNIDCKICDVLHSLQREAER